MFKRGTGPVFSVRGPAATQKEGILTIVWSPSKIMSKCLQRLTILHFIFACHLFLWSWLQTQSWEKNMCVLFMESINDTKQRVSHVCVWSIVVHSYTLMHLYYHLVWNKSVNLLKKKQWVETKSIDTRFSAVVWKMLWSALHDNCQLIRSIHDRWMRDWWFFRTRDQSWSSDF